MRSNSARASPTLATGSNSMTSSLPDVVVVTSIDDLTDVEVQEVELSVTGVGRAPDDAAVAATCVDKENDFSILISIKEKSTIDWLSIDHAVFVYEHFNDELGCP